MNATLSRVLRLRMRSLLSPVVLRALELVADPVDGKDKAWVAGVMFDLAPEVFDVRVHRALVALEGVAVDAVDQLHPREHLVRMAREGLEHPELRRRQVDRPPGQRDLMAAHVDQHLAEPEHLGRLLTAPPQDGA